MKKALKWVGLSIVAIVVVVVGGFFIYMYTAFPKSKPAADLKATSTPEAIARGEYLANSVAACTACHSKVDEDGEKVLAGTLGGGRNFAVAPTSKSKIRASNITPDKTHGIGDYTDGELVRAIREGINKKGEAIFPMMPYRSYAATLSDADALAIVAYLRTLKPLSDDPGRTELTFPMSMFVRTTPEPVGTPAAPPPADPVAHGEWLMKVGACADCHDGQDEHHEPIPGKHFAGGQRYWTDKGPVYAANITSDSATGIGAYSDDDIMKVFNEGVNKAGKPLRGMPWAAYKGMTEKDKRDMIAALRKVPPVANIVVAKGN